MPDDSEHEEITLNNGRTFERYTGLVKDDQGRTFGRVYQYHDITVRKARELELTKHLAVAEQSHAIERLFHSIHEHILEGETIATFLPTACDQLAAIFKLPLAVIRIKKEFGASSFVLGGRSLLQVRENKGLPDDRRGRSHRRQALRWMRLSPRSAI